MRELHEFAAGEWLRLVPLAQGLRQLRNDLLLARYLRARTPDLEPFLAEQQSLRGRQVALVIAFEQPWALDWQLRMAARNLPGTQVLVFDNSRDAEKRRQIRHVCDHHGVPYLGLPPYRTRHANRSHGMAMSWIHHNVVRPLEPDVFGYLDHDLIPVAPVDVGERVGAQPVFGLPNIGRPGYWSLWAGYCFFRHAFTRGKPLNFLYDFSRELDTGGRNWDVLYRGLDRASLRFAPQEFVALRPAGQAEARKVEIVDGAWVHVGGVSYNDNFEKKGAFLQAVLEEIEAGRRWEDLRV